MRQLTPKKVTIADKDFFITPFAAFYAANLSGEIMAVLAPILTGLTAILSSGGEEISLENIKIDEALPKIAPALSSLDGDKVETILRKLLINKSNISYSYNEDGVEYKGKLTYDEVNEIFCQDIFGLYKLAWEVIDLNYGSFFGKAPVLSGSPDVVTFQKR